MDWVFSNKFFPIFGCDGYFLMELFDVTAIGSVSNVIVYSLLRGILQFFVWEFINKGLTGSILESVLDVVIFPSK